MASKRTEEAFFDPREPIKEGNDSVVEAGVYLAAVQKSQRKEKDGNLGLILFLSILSPADCRGRSIMDYFNLTHSSEKVQVRGRQKLVSLLEYMGRGQEALMNEKSLEKEVVKIAVGQKPHYLKPGEMQNYVIKYMMLEESDLESLKAAELAPLDYNDLPF